jgi:hypothetical protein
MGGIVAVNLSIRERGAQERRCLRREGRAQQEHKGQQPETDPAAACPLSDMIAPEHFFAFTRRVQLLCQRGTRTPRRGKNQHAETTPVQDSVVSSPASAYEWHFLNRAEPFAHHCSSISSLRFSFSDVICHAGYQANDRISSDRTWRCHARSTSEVMPLDLTIKQQDAD